MGGRLPGTPGADLWVRSLVFPLRRAAPLRPDAENQKTEIGFRRCPERGHVEEWINRRFEIGDCNFRAVWGAGDA